MINVKAPTILLAQMRDVPVKNRVWFDVFDITTPVRNAIEDNKIVQHMGVVCFNIHKLENAPDQFNVDFEQTTATQNVMLAMVLEVSKVLMVDCTQEERNNLTRTAFQRFGAFTFKAL